MPQIFHRSSNTIAKASIVAVALLVGGLGFFAYEVNQSGYYSYVNVARQQPVPFSHKHHVTDDGIDCRYCHTLVEKSPFAGVPTTQICMSCHSKLWLNSNMLEPVRSSYVKDVSLQWTRVNTVPDFVYFNHSIHVKKGVGCTTCHGPIGQMPLTYRANTLYMRWCINCHNHPEKYVRPRAEVFNAAYVVPSNQVELGRQLVKEYKIKPPKEITDCYTCHR
jgi:formamidopyrimidine-DNA glycosylase